MQPPRIRPAAAADAAELLRVRYDAIMAVRLPGVAEDRVRRWAERRDLSWMRRALQDRETWVGMVDDHIVSWIAVEEDRVEGLYTDPRNAGHGIGSALLHFVEGLVKSRGFEHIRLDASPNAEAFYRKRGYAPVGPVSSDGAQPMHKVLTPTG